MDSPSCVADLTGTEVLGHLIHQYLLRLRTRVGRGCFRASNTLSTTTPRSPACSPQRIGDVFLDEIGSIPHGTPGRLVDGSVLYSEVGDLGEIVTPNGEEFAWCLSSGQTI